LNEGRQPVGRVWFSLFSVNELDRNLYTKTSTPVDTSFEADHWAHRADGCCQGAAPSGW